MNDVLAAVKRHFPDAKFVGIENMTETTGPAPKSRACTNCKREALPGLTYRDQPICAPCAPYAGSLPMITTDTEEEALEAGGNAGGQYLDSIGKTDLATLSPLEWSTFLSKVLEGYGEHMRDAAVTTAPF